MPSRALIEEFLAQPRIGFVGVSRDPRQFANTVYRHLRTPERTLVPVHREATEVEGDRCVARLADAGPLDGVVIMLPPGPAALVVGDAIACGVPRVWLHRGTGTGAVSPEAVQACRRAGVAVVDGACPMMFAEPVGWFHRAHRGLVHRHITA